MCGFDRERRGVYEGDDGLLLRRNRGERKHRDDSMTGVKGAELLGKEDCDKYAEPTQGHIARIITGTTLRMSSPSFGPSRFSKFP